MNGAILRSLLWKEWREHRWKLAALVTIALGGILLGAIAEQRMPRLVGAVNAFQILYFTLGTLGAIFIAMGAAASENSNKTIGFVQAMPMSARKLALVKLCFGILTAWAPVMIAVSAISLLLTLGDWYEWEGLSQAKREFGTMPIGFAIPFKLCPELVTYAANSLLVSMSLFLWVAALGVNSSHEVRAAAKGLVGVAGVWGIVITAFFLLTPLLGSPSESNLEWFRQFKPLYALLPLGTGLLVTPARGWQELSFIFVFYAMTHAPLACWYVTRFGKSPLGEAMPISKSSNRSWLGAPRHSPIQAILWKHARQCGPVMLVAVVCATVLFSAATYNSYQVTTGTSQLSVEHLTQEVRLIGGIFFTLFGALAGLVAGVGVSTGDLEPRLKSFWQSRPMSIDLWFTTAFGTGLAMLLLVFGIPIAAGFGAVGWWEASLAIALILLPYAAGWLAGVVFIHPIYASLFALSLFITAYMVFVAAMDRVEGGGNLQKLYFCGALYLITATMTLAAWVCVRNDWSLRLS